MSVMLCPFLFQPLLIQHRSVQHREEEEIPIWQHYRDYHEWWAALIWDTLWHLSALKLSSVLPCSILLKNNIAGAD